ncbi:hypothetical protein MRX96_008253 [Rhipicephalus microplus]
MSKLPQPYHEPSTVRGTLWRLIHALTRLVCRRCGKPSFKGRRVMCVFCHKCPPNTRELQCSRQLIFRGSSLHASTSAPPPRSLPFLAEAARCCGCFGGEATWRQCGEATTVGASFDLWSKWRIRVAQAWTSG